MHQEAAMIEIPMMTRHHGDFNHRDRKSTRLNSSHTVISYAVFCLKKKKKKKKDKQKKNKKNKKKKKTQTTLQNKTIPEPKKANTQPRDNNRPIRYYKERRDYSNRN